MNHPIHDIENTAAIPRSRKALLNRPLPLQADLSINGVSGMLLVIKTLLDSGAIENEKLVHRVLRRI